MRERDVILHYKTVKKLDEIGKYFDNGKDLWKERKRKTKGEDS